MRVSTRRAIALFDIRGPKRSESDVLSALAVEPGNARLHVLLSYCRLARGDINAARRSAETAVGYDPTCSAAFRVLAVVEKACRRPQQALSAIGEALRLESNDADLHFVKSVILYEVGRYESALFAAEHGLRCDPRDTRCGNIKATVLMQIGRLGAAATVLRELAVVDPECAWTFENLGLLALRRDRPAEAYQYFCDSLRLEPNRASSRLGALEANVARSSLYRRLCRLLALRREDEFLDLLMRLFAVWPALALFIGVALLVVPPYGQSWTDLLSGAVLGSSVCTAALFILSILFRVAASPLVLVIIGLHPAERKFMVPAQVVQSRTDLARILTALIAPAVAVALRSFQPLWIGAACVAVLYGAAYVLRSEEGRVRRLIRTALVAAALTLATIALSWMVVEFGRRTWWCILAAVMVAMWCLSLRRRITYE